MENKKKFYITTPIYYPSGKFHIGTAYTTILTDTIKRYKALRGYDSYMLTGLDEHGQKIQTVAEKEGSKPQEYVDKMAETTKKLWKDMNISYSDFIRTTDKRHEETVAKIFEKLLAQGDIYKGEYEGWYCMPCETYFTQTQLVDGKCPDCGRDVQLMKEETYFFNMKKYQKRLEEFYEKNPYFIQPESRKNELFNNFIKPGVEDLCVSRTSFDWGVKVPSDPKHVVYVWLDALTNYITALGYMQEDDSKFKKYWPADLHIIGKDIIRFHGIYWPIFLMALDLPLPKKIYAHGFISIRDGKMSKSKGNVIYPENLTERYGVDATKYFLLREFAFDQDISFTPESFVNRFNADLANDLGNLLNRTIAMCNKYFGGNVPKYNGIKNDVDKEIEEFAINTTSKFEKAFENFEIASSIQEIWSLVSRTNKYIDETSPWVLAKEENKEKLESCIYHLIENLRRIAILISPIMDATSEKMFKQLGIENPELKTYESLKNYDKIENVKVIEKGEPLFMRLNAEEEIEYIKSKMKK